MFRLLPAGAQGVSVEGLDRGQIDRRAVLEDKTWEDSVQMVHLIFWNEFKKADQLLKLSNSLSWLPE